MKTLAVLVAALVIAAIAAPAAAHNYYESKYAPVAQDENLNQVYAKGNLQGFHNLFNQHIDVTGPQGAFEVAIDNTGAFELYNLIPGTYTLTITDGVGGQPETTTIVVPPGAVGPVFLEHPLIGHLVSADDRPAALRAVTVTEAKYGKIVYSQEIDTPAYDEQVYHAGQARHANLVYQGHGQFDYEAGHVHARQLNNAQVDFVHDCRNYHITGDKHDDAFVVTQAGYTETIHHPATYKTVATGAVVDVKAQVQAAVNAGHFNLKFNNAQNPGGLFDADTGELIAQIDDPAFGIVKDVLIKADGRTINSQEYQVINL